MLDLGTAQPQASSPAPISDATTATFEKDVLQASLQRPVIVDLWAPWCGPCRQLMPLLEKAVTAAAGAVALVKINIDENPEIAQALRVQSVPTVYAFYQAQPVDGFAGMQTEQGLKDFIARLLAAAGKNAATEAPEEGAAASAEQIAAILASAEDAFWSGDLQGAANGYGHVLSQDEQNAAAIDGMTLCLLALGEEQAARDSLAEGTATTPRAAFFLSQAEAARGLDAQSLQTAIDKNPKDHDSRYKLAQALLARAQAQEAIDVLLDAVRLDRNWNEQAARLLLVGVFEALGPAHPLVAGGRRRLSSLLFS